MPRCRLDSARGRFFPLRPIRFAGSKGYSQAKALVGGFAPGKDRGPGFTLVEMLVALAVLMLISAFMLEISAQAGRLWTQGESRNQYRQRARAVLDFMARDLKLAGLGPIRDGKFQFVVNPQNLPDDYKNHDSVFWQAPVATDVIGGMAEVGYFVRWENDRPNLCRFFVNASDADYQIYSKPGDWVNPDNLLNTIGSATAANNFRGLFLENVIGMWVKTYQSDGTACPDWDSRQMGNTLPGKVDVSLVLLDSVAVGRLDAAKISGIKALVKGSDSANGVMDNLPDWCKTHASLVSLSVYLDNSQ